MTVFQFKKGSFLTGDAQAVGDKLTEIKERDGAITPDAVVQEAKPKKSVLHGYFEWDDSKAANEFRLNQARHLTRNIIAVSYKEGEPAESYRAFTHISRAVTESPGYYSTIDTMRDDERRVYVLSKIRDLLQSTYRKLQEYRSYEELSEVLEAIESFDNQYAEIVSKAS